MFLTKTQSFAIEMAKACLPQLPSPEPLTGPWQEYDFHEADRREGHPLPRLMIRLRGVEHRIEAAYTTSGSSADGPTTGTCLLNFEGTGGCRTFRCWLQDNQMRTLAEDTTLDAFGLEWKTVLKLSKAHVKTVHVLDNQRLWELAMLLSSQAPDPWSYSELKELARQKSPELMAEVHDELLAFCQRMAACGYLVEGWHFDSIEELSRYMLECSQGVTA